MCTLTHNSPRCSLLRNGAQTDCRNTSSALCYPWRSLRSPSQPKPRLSAQLTRQHREGPLPFSGLFGQHAHGWRQLELPPLNHQLLAAFAAHQLRAVHEAAIQQVVSTGRRHHAHMSRKGRNGPIQVTIGCSSTPWQSVLQATSQPEHVLTLHFFTFTLPAPTMSACRGGSEIA